MADGKLTFDTSLDPSGFSKGVKGINDVFKGMVLFKGFEMALNAFKNSFDAAFSRMDTADKFKRVMTVMTGDVKIANKALAETTGIVKGTAYGLNVAAQSVQNFVSRGMQVDKATNSIRLWGDAVAFYGDGTNETFASVTDALSKMQTNGKVQMREMQQLFYAGIPALDIYAKATGQSTQEVSAQMQRGKLNSNDFINAMNRAFQTGVEGFPKVAGAAKEAGASWAGTFDNMKAAIARGTESMLKSIDRALKSANLPTIKQTITNFGKAFEGVLKTVGKMIGSLIPILKPLTPIFVGLVAITTAYGVAMAAVAAKAKIVMAIEAASLALKKAQSIAESIYISWLLAENTATWLATGAQIALNAAMYACPILMLVAGIGLLVSALMGWGQESNATAKQIEADTDATISKQDDLNNKMIDSANSYRESSASLKEHSEQARALIGELEYLSDTQSSNMTVSGRQRDVTSQLVELYPELSNVVDATTGIIDMNNVATSELVTKTMAYVDAMKQYELAAQRYAEVTEEKTTANVNYATTVDQVAYQEKQLAEGKAREAELDKEVAKASSEATKLILEGGEAYQKACDKTDALNAEYRDLQITNNALEDSNKKLNDSLKDQKGAQEEAAKAAKEAKVQAASSYGTLKEKTLEYLKVDNQVTEEIASNLATLIKEKDKYDVEWKNGEMELIESARSACAEKILAKEQEIQAIKDGTIQVSDALGEELLIRHAAGDELTELETAQLEQFKSKKAETEEAYKKHFESVRGIVTDGFTGIKEQSSISMDDWMANMNAKNEAVANWGNNIEALMKAGVHDGVIQQLIEMGEGGMEQAQVFVNELNSMNDGADIALGGVNETTQNRISDINGTMERNIATTGEVASKFSGVIPEKMEEAAARTQTSFKLDSTSAVAEVQKFTGDIEATFTQELSPEVAGTVGNEYGKQVALNIELGFNEGAVGLGTRITTFMANVATSIEMSSGAVQAAMSNVMLAVGNAVTNGASAVGPGITSMMSLMIMGIVSAAPSAQTAMLRVMQQMITAVKTGANQVKSAIQSMMSQAVSAVVSHAPAMASAGMSVASAVANGIRNGYGAVYNAGYYVMQGMSSAMTDYTPVLYSKAETIATGIAAKLRKAFDINSPSRLMYGIFENVMLGMIKPMDDMMPTIFGKVDNIKAGFVKRITGLSPLNGTVGGTLRGSQSGNSGITNINYNQELNINGDVNDPATLRRRAKDLLRLGGMASGK